MPDRLLAYISLAVSAVLIIVLLGIRPHPSFDADQQGAVEPAEVVFTNRSTGTAECLWIFGDGTTSTVWSPTHTYVQPGTYHPLLLLRTRWGAVMWSLNEVLIEVEALPPDVDVKIEDIVDVEEQR